MRWGSEGDLAVELQFVHTLKLVDFALLRIYEHEREVDVD